ncbi:MAG: hypothetical protein EU542_07130 [Promethearchaeota archaeon]|nr:MAG: hypothetical protein EU542_07130 [Candidatus Lokiarchaeota archaeon]
MSIKDITSFKYVIPIGVVIWTILLMIIAKTLGNVSPEMFFIFVSMFIAIIIGIDGVRRTEGNNLRIIVALFNIIIGLSLLLFGFSLIRSALILMIGGELFGISTAIRLKGKTFDSTISTSTRRPSPVPEPEPEPKPM